MAIPTTLTQTDNIELRLNKLMTYYCAYANLLHSTALIQIDEIVPRLYKLMT